MNSLVVEEILADGSARWAAATCHALPPVALSNLLYVQLPEVYNHRKSRSQSMLRSNTSQRQAL
jgi:hypothetical protein